MKEGVSFIDEHTNLDKKFICYIPKNEFYKFAYCNHPHFISSKNSYIENIAPNRMEISYADYCYKNKFKIYFYTLKTDDIRDYLNNDMKEVEKYSTHIGGLVSYRR